MKKKNKRGMVLIIVAGFIAGIVAEMLIRQFLPGMAPEMSVEVINFIALAVRAALSVVIVLFAVFVRGGK